MMAERLEVRLDPERRRRLAEVARVRGEGVSEVVRSLIDRAYDEVCRAQRLEAARGLVALEVEDVPDPEELGRQLDATYELPLR